MLTSLRRGSLYKRIVVSLIVLNIVGFMAWGITAGIRSFTKAGQGALSPRLGRMFVNQGVMTSADFTEYNYLYTQLSYGKSFSDTDINWLIALMNRPAAPNLSSESRAIRHDCALEIFNAYLKTGHATQSQRNSIFDAASPLLASEDTTGLDAISASAVLRTLNDKRAIPLLLPLVNSPNPQVRTTAVNSLKFMGYDSGR